MFTPSLPTSASRSYKHTQRTPPVSKLVQTTYSSLQTHHEDITALIVHANVRLEDVKMEGRSEQTTVPEPTITLSDKQAFSFKNAHASTWNMSPYHTDGSIRQVYVV